MRIFLLGLVSPVKFSRLNWQIIMLKKRTCKENLQSLLNMWKIILLLETCLDKEELNQKIYRHRKILRNWNVEWREKRKGRINRNPLGVALAPPTQGSHSLRNRVRTSEERLPLEGKALDGASSKVPTAPHPATHKGWPPSPRGRLFSAPFISAPISTAQIWQDSGRGVPRRYRHSTGKLWINMCIKHWNIRNILHKAIKTMFHEYGTVHIW